MKIKGTNKRPRLSVFRSHKAIYGQIIDDQVGKTLISACDKELKTTKKIKSEKAVSSKAFQTGELLAKKALAKKIKRIVFDRGRYRYHGKVRELAEGARKGGLKF